VKAKHTKQTDKKLFNNIHFHTHLKNSDLMSMRKFLFIALFASIGTSIAAQDAMAPTAPYRSFSSPDQWELGVHVGLPMVIGDLDAKIPAFGGGLHVRKSLDHIFSVRATTLFAKAENEDDAFGRASDITWISGGADVVVALNNMIFNKPNRRLLINAFGGLGGTRSTVNYSGIPVRGTGEDKFTAAYISGGAGVAYRVSPKFNIGLEYRVNSTFGKQGDQLDGDDNRTLDQTSYRDNLHYPHLVVAFNLGGKDKKTGLAKAEPRYWRNPIDEITGAISALEARPIYNPNDADNDGIIDDIDQEDDSPAGARVDSKGVTLDSDGDKVPDYKDKEPYSPPGYPVDAMGVAQVPKPNYVTEADVNRIVDAKLANFKLPTQQSVTDWFLPMVNFDLNSYTVKKSEYEKIYQVAQVAKNNPTLRFVVSGNTDRTSSETYNNVLSFNRATAVIAILTTQYGIARDRFVLNYAGESNNIVNTTAANLTNRRVEFRVAKAGDAEMARPEGPKAGVGRIEGNTSGF
jgi:OmpA-OmpF porin, OOP family